MKVGVWEAHYTSYSEVSVFDRRTLESWQMNKTYHTLTVARAYNTADGACIANMEH